MTPEQMASFIDHTLLKPDASESDIINLCNDAITYNFKSICINPHWIPLCAERLKPSIVNICTVAGFPLGATSTSVKSYETQWAIDNGADEIDMVMNIGALKSNLHDVVLEDIETIKSICNTIPIKVIIETAVLNDDEIKKACRIAKQAKADFVKTSTGFSSRGATIKDIQLMRETVGLHTGIKASGGIRTFTDAMKMIDAGATRIGTSNGVQIVQDCKNGDNR